MSGVTQADRDTANAYFDSKNGDLLPDAFTRHRQATEAPLLEIIAQLEAALEETTCALERDDDPEFAHIILSIRATLARIKGDKP